MQLGEELVGVPASVARDELDRHLVQLWLERMTGCGFARVPPPEPWVRLLPALDPTIMGWAGRDWFLGEHGSALFDRSGNVGPTVWSDGRIVGGWAQRRDGEIVVRLLEDVGADARTAVDEEAVRLQAWLGPVRITPRFRTPLERELTD